MYNEKSNMIIRYNSMIKLSVIWGDNMSFTFPNGSQYNLILLDTNALSEISKNIRDSQSGFINRFPSNKYAPCFSTYSLFELRKADKAYQAFVEFFSTYPCLILQPYKHIIIEEIKSYKTNSKPEIILNAFVSNGENETYDLQLWLDHMWGNKSLVNEINKNSNEYSIVAGGWQKQRKNSALTYSKSFEEGCLRNFLFSIDPIWVKNNSTFDVYEFAGTRMMLFSQFMRVHKSKKLLGGNDVNDVMISAVIPYIDAIITERSQAEVIKQAKSKIPQLKNVEISTLSEIRRSK